MSVEIIYEGEACTDCLMIMANGTLGQGDYAAEAAYEDAMYDWLDNWLMRTDYHLAPSGDDEPYFSWQPCNSCGSPLGGNRHKFAVLA